MPSQTIQRIAARDSVGLNACFNAGRPALITSAIADWPSAAWSFESLCQRFGDRDVTALLDLPRGGGRLPSGQDCYEHRCSFKEFVAMALDPERQPCYLGYAKASDWFPGDQNEFRFQVFNGGWRGATDTRLWIGSANTCSGLHSDLKDNIFVQIAGTKRVVLVPFSQTPLVYPFVDNIVNSQVDPENYDPARYPKFVGADVYEFVVQPGDAVYIPKGWWHYLRSCEPSISINHWFGEGITSSVYLKLMIRLGPKYIGRALFDMLRYSILGERYRRDFFFSPASSGERLFELVRHGDFSRENDPVRE